MIRIFLAHFCKLLLCAALTAALPFSSLLAQEKSGGAGGLLVTPTRLVLEGRTRAGEIHLSNQGEKEATYRISLKSLRMDEKGQYHEEKTPEAPPAAELLRFSPRQVTLKPGETQTVKLMLRKPEGLANGEYRSHMLFQTMPDASMGEDVEKVTTAEGITIRMVPVLGVTIPVIVRSGALDANAAIAEPGISGDMLRFVIAREGSKSTYGDILVTQGERVVAEQRGIAVFTPNARRDIQVKLHEFSRGQPLHIAYRAREEDGGKPIAEATLTP